MSSSTRVGTEVAGYRLERVLGRGGMSVVYLAEHIRLGRKVALKLLAPALSEDESYRERFIRESRRAAELDHPNIIPIYDAGEDDGQLYIAMRYVQGADLKGVIKREGHLSLGRVLFVLEQVVGALEAAHEHDLVHRDVKPSNILVSEPSDRVYLTDFGVVKHTASHGLTKTGFFIGTVDYAPPEQIEGLPLDLRTDIYALGCVFYECLAGRPPFDRDGEVAVMHAHLVEPPPRLTTAQPDLPKALNGVVAKAMAKSKEDRYSTCEEFLLAARDASFQRETSVKREVPPEILAMPSSGSDEEPPSSADEPWDQPSVVVAGGPLSGSSNPTPTPAQDGAPSAPPPEPPAGPPTDPEQPGAGRRRMRLKLAPWLRTALLVLVVAAGTGAAVYFATNSDSNNTTTGGGGGGAGQAVGIAGIIPPLLFKNSCVIQSTPLIASAVQSAVCTPPANATDYYPSRWEVSTFRNSTDLQTAYESIRTDNGIGQDLGRCDRTTWTGEGAWTHNGVTGKGPGGRRLCYFEGNVPVIVWTHEKLGQPSHVDMLATARDNEGDHGSLFNWWRFWHHNGIGKCSGAKCTAKLQ